MSKTETQTRSEIINKQLALLEPARLAAWATELSDL